LPPETKPRIDHAMDGLTEDPRGTAQKLAAGEGYRIRVGDYRIVFRIDDDAQEVLVARIKHRRDVYRR
jgi:mRNA interferase RelE/StbE